jgi:hypothetical protein
MNCFIHTDTAACAICQGCNCCLCRTCTERFGASFCEQCFLAQYRTVRREVYTGLFLTTAIFAGTTWFFANLRDSAGLPALQMASAAMVGLLLAFTYWGWKFLTRYFPSLWFGTGIGWLIYAVMKAIAAYFIGLIVGPFQIIKMLNQLRIAYRVKQQIARGQL